MKPLSSNVQIFENSALCAYTYICILVWVYMNMYIYMYVWMERDENTNLWKHEFVKSALCAYTQKYV